MKVSYANMIAEVVSTNKLTELEERVYRAGAKVCWEDCWFTCDNIAEQTGLLPITVRAVVGSLVKKGVVLSGEFVIDGSRMATLNIILNGEPVSFGWDIYKE